MVRWQMLPVSLCVMARTSLNHPLCKRYGPWYLHGNTASTTASHLQPPNVLRRQMLLSTWVCRSSCRNYDLLPPLGRLQRSRMRFGSNVPCLSHVTPFSCRSCPSHPEPRLLQDQLGEKVLLHVKSAYPNYCRFDSFLPSGSFA